MDCLALLTVHFCSTRTGAPLTRQLLKYPVDQQDQKMTLVRNVEKLYWDFETAETELWKEPPDSILESISQFITADNPEWSGTATELAERLGTDLKPNVLTLKLNVTAGRLLNEYNITYATSRTHSGRNVTLKLKT